jgi:hypothetical protein
MNFAGFAKSPKKDYAAKSPLVIAGNGKDIDFYMDLYENEPTYAK